MLDGDNSVDSSVRIYGLKQEGGELLIGDFRKLLRYNESQ